MTAADTADVVIAGGGVIGLAVALSLAKENVSVIVLEVGQVGGQATGAAAGMLAPLAETRGPGPFLTLGLASLERYPGFVSELHEETAIDSELIGPGMLRVAVTPLEAHDLSQQWEWQQELPLHMDCLGAKEARMLEPALTPDVLLAIRSPEERNVEPRRLARALAIACANRGVRLVEGAPVTGFVNRGARITGASTPTGVYECGNVVLAGGAWSGILGNFLHVDLPVRPVRGQILSLACNPSPIRHTIYTAAGYLVPKADGRIVVGATEDEAGFDARPNAGGIAYLLNTAGGLVPELASAVFHSAWAGLRPASLDSLPLMGRLPGWVNAYAACGHFRNGVLLAPITGEIVSSEIMSGAQHPLAQAFRPARFEELDVAGDPS